MKMNWVLSCVVLTGLLAVPGFAELLNGDFEYWSDHPDDPIWAYVSTIQDDPDVGWTSSGNAWLDDGYGGYQHILGTNGDRVMVMSWGDATTAVAQNLGISLVPGETYTFSIDIYGESATEDTGGQGAGEHWCIGIGMEEAGDQDAVYRQQNALALAASNAQVGDQWTKGDLSDYTVLDPPDIFAGWETRRVSYTATPVDAGKTISVFFSGGFQEVGVDGDTCFDNAQLLIGPLDPNLAAQPYPANGTSEVSRMGVLSWKPGASARIHDVYFGTDPEEVKGATTPKSSGQAASSFDPGVLEFGRSYYWRVDEVGPGTTVHKGSVWSFTVEPFSIPVANITATASGSQSDTMSPEKTVDGSGLSDLDQHSDEPTDMWLSAAGAAPWIQYEFDKAYKLHEMWVWNSNQIIESFMGLGAKDVVIETSLDGADWTVLEDAPQLAQATGMSDYAANTKIDFAGVMARFVKITINSGYGLIPQYGLSELRFLAIPTYAREPQPADGDITDSADVTLTWRAGREAVSHQVALGTDAADVPVVGTTSEAVFNATKLSYSTTYFWSVTEVNESEAVTAYAGDLWSFTTPDYGTVDDFDQYNDDCKRIFFAWVDGLGHNGGTEIDDCDVAPSSGNGGGATVGNDTAPFADTTLVNAGGSTQSLPLSYDNAFGPSEAILSLDGQDWSASEVQTLSLAVFGAQGNTGQLYVKVNNTKVMYDGDVTQAQWLPWLIDLTALSALQNVNSLTLGVDGANAAGMLYIDDIRLYPRPIEFITPVEPDAAALLVHYAFDEGAGDQATDASGQGNHAAIMGQPQWVSGIEGSAIYFDGTNDYVSAEKSLLSGLGQFTLACWIKADVADADRSGLVGQNDCVEYGFSSSNTMQIWTPGGGSLNYAWPYDETDWHHVAAVGDGVSLTIYLDGRPVATGGNATDNYGASDYPLNIAGGGVFDDIGNAFFGQLDDVRVYNQALSPEELASIAGHTELLQKPF